MNAVVDRPLWAWLALAAPIIVALAFAWQHRRRLKRVAALGVEAAVKRLAPPGVRRPPYARGARIALALALATLGFAGPRWGEGTTLVRNRGLDVAIAMDASLSMMAEDERPSRLQRMRQEVRRYRASSPGDRNALIAFAGKSYILTPLTTDDGAFELFLDNFDPNIVGLAGTALAPTILQGTGLLQAANGSASRVLVILSDGEAFDDHAAAISAARAAKAAGISIITVGFGTEDGSTIPVREGGNIVQKRDSDGQTVITKYDPALLKAVAEAAGGEFIPSSVGDRGGRITQALGRLDAEQRDVEEGLSRPLRLAWFLLPAFLLLLVDAWRTDGGSWNRVRRLLRVTSPAALALLLVPATPGDARAQGPAKLYEQGKYREAAQRWRQQIDKGDKRFATLYDLGTALLAADSLATAEEALERAAATPEARIRRLALYNLGLARLKRALKNDEADRQRAAEGAMAAYRSLLQEQPNDDDAKWNFELALRVKREQQSGGSSQNQQQNQPQQSQGNPREQERQMSRQQAEQLLSAASRDERETQARKQAGTRTQRPPGGKEW
jgi:Ca-activated chloride channel family protein